MGEESPFTLEELDAEIAEKTEDLHVFSSARELVRNRVVALKDSTSKLSPLPVWSGTDAVLGSLDLSIHAIERTLSELYAVRKELGEKVSSQRPMFTVIQGGNTE